MGKRMEYKWRLREIMASRGLNNISDILPLLNDRGIDLSSSQIYRLIGQKPERISLQLTANSPVNNLVKAASKTLKPANQIHDNSASCRQIFVVLRGVSRVLANLAIADSTQIS